MYLFPQLVPKTMEQLTLRADDEEALKQQEAAYEAKMAAVRDHLRDTTALGQEPATPDDTEVDDDEVTEEESPDEDGVGSEVESISDEGLI